MKSVFSKLTSVALAATIVVGGFNINASASELEANTDEVTEVSSSTSGGSTRASWGKGILRGENPWGSKPSAYSITQTNGGKAYKLETQAFSSNDGIGTTSSQKGTADNDSSVQCGGLVSKTESTRFTSDHSIKDTATSGWQTTDNVLEY